MDFPKLAELEQISNGLSLADLPPDYLRYAQDGLPQAMSALHLAAADTGSEGSKGVES